MGLTLRSRYDSELLLFADKNLQGGPSANWPCACGQHAAMLSANWLSLNQAPVLSACCCCAASVASAGIIDNPISVFLKLLGLKKGGENLE
jgi:hypothetical protein